MTSFVFLIMYFNFNCFKCFAKGLAFCDSHVMLCDVRGNISHKLQVDVYVLMSVFLTVKNSFNSFKECSSLKQTLKENKVHSKDKRITKLRR